jgi:hypothetical protein
VLREQEEIVTAVGALDEALERHRALAEGQRDLRLALQAALLRGDVRVASASGVQAA